MLLQFYMLTIHIKYTLTKKHTHTTQLGLSMWIWAKKHQILVSLYIIKPIQQNSTTIYSQFFKYNNETRSLIIHTKPLEKPDNANKKKKKSLIILINKKNKTITKNKTRIHT